jgi:hypothetical protein
MTQEIPAQFYHFKAMSRMAPSAASLMGQLNCVILAGVFFSRFSFKNTTIFYQNDYPSITLKHSSIPSTSTSNDAANL